MDDRNVNNRNMFDRMIEWRVFSPFRELYYNNREIILYLIFGGLTFFLSIAVFVVINKMEIVDVLVSNIISWISGVTFSFFTTRKFVFDAKTDSGKGFFRQFVSFYFARVATLLLQELIIFVFVKKMSINSTVVKAVSEVINIVLNYIVSKYIIFRKRTEK